jgi:hypothetical protein
MLVNLFNRYDETQLRHPDLSKTTSSLATMASAPAANYGVAVESSLATGTFILATVLVVGIHTVVKSV